MYKRRPGEFQGSGGPDTLPIRPAAERTTCVGKSPIERTFVRYSGVTRPAPNLPGYVSVGRASEVLHLAPRSVRDLIYAGRLPSLRVGRLHYIKAADLDRERRRRLGLPLRSKPVRDRSPRPRSAAVRSSTTPVVDEAGASKPPIMSAGVLPGFEDTTAPPPRTQAPRAASRRPTDIGLRRQRAAERAELATRWAQHHHLLEPRVPATVVAVTAPTLCESCGRQVRRGRVVSFVSESAPDAASTLCLTCARRALLAWADQRRLESAAARRLAHSLAQPEITPESPRAVA